MAGLRHTIGTYRQLVRGALALRRTARAARAADEVVDAVAGLSIAEIPLAPVQVRSELVEFLSLLRAERPARLLEVGTGNGGTLYLLSWAAAADARILSVDLRPLPRPRRLLYRLFAGRRQRLAVWSADSHATETRDEVRRFFRGEPLDVVFIDGDHTYEGVRRDFELYAPLVRPGGVIAFHDIVDGPETAVGGVPRFWREVRSSLAEPLELVESWAQGGFGIGVGRAVPQGAR